MVNDTVPKAVIQFQRNNFIPFINNETTKLSQNKNAFIAWECRYEISSGYAFCAGARKTKRYNQL